MDYLTIFQDYNQYLPPMKVFKFRTPPTFYLLTFFAIFSMSGCEIEEEKPADPCEGVSCQTGYVCYNGSCVYNSSSQLLDPCADVVCLNGGNCVNGVCDCPPGYDGDDCSNKLTPSKVSIERITITRFPAKRSNGSDWDNTSTGLPDLWMVIGRDGLTGYVHRQPESSAISNASPSSTHVYTPTSPIVLSNFTINHTITLYDYDGDPASNAPDLMGDADFVPFMLSRLGFPVLLNVDNGGNVAFQVRFAYEFD